MSISRVKNWVAGEVLTAADLNSEFNNILNNALPLISPLTANLDFNNNQAVNFRFEVKTATQTAAQSGRAYWQSSEGAVHVDTGTLIGRVPALTTIREGRLIGIQNPSGIGGATRYTEVQLGTGLALTEGTGGSPGTLTNTAVPVITGSYQVRNLVGAPNVGTPNTKFDLTSADLVVLRNPTDDSIVIKTAVGLFTCDLTVAQAVNGRDSAGALGVNLFAHFYYIVKANGTGLGSLASGTAPPSGPALPTGYTHWAYAGAVFNVAGPALVKTRMRGASMFYEAQQSALSDGSSTVETAVGLSTLVPPNASQVILQAAFHIITNGGDRSFKIRYISGTDFFTLRNFTDANSPANPGLFNSSLVVLPNASQQVFYLFDAALPASSGGSLWVLGYVVPNGGE